ncbi:uncharacterized protein BDZ99DRAFT_266198 [Mytilinidion resinicola]|uniref:Uncharacterized protein n=1 Tax=Mytilinidion resinicola TaxID=574789 RepID=A0A6A6YU03_9PEZI|nr:uncharacterized protein BDZ99DRAFT_266198 [Mytilinidion resinicola]KAF2812412.1 hypothetical protein BDZ99DRAFT_266198 [Mytilinidion resinicola]
MACTLRREYRTLCQWCVLLKAGFRDAKSRDSTIRVLCRQAFLIEDILSTLNRTFEAMGIDRQLDQMGQLVVDDDFYLSRLKASSICPSLYTRLRTWGISELEYACVLQDDSSVQENRHDHCTPGACSTNSLSTSTFQARHMKDDCKCDWIKISIPSIRNALDTDNYFVLHIPTLIDTRSNPSDAVRLYSRSLQYVAVSHVWSHGAGSGADDGLARCRLQSFINKLPGQS